MAVDRLMPLSKARRRSGAEACLEIRSVARHESEAMGFGSRSHKRIYNADRPSRGLATRNDIAPELGNGPVNGQDAAFETRRPYISEVSPLSPVLVTIDINRIVGRFCETPIDETPLTEPR